MTLDEYIGALKASTLYAHYRHWRTTSYAEHKALGKYYTKMNDHVDLLAEAYMGLTGRPIQAPVNLPVHPEREPEQYFVALSASTRALGQSEQPPEGYGALKNILDDIATLIEQTRYLLTLK